MNEFNSPLRNLKIASPCSADWNGMTGDERKRFCGQCQLHVYNLSEMSKKEAEDLLHKSEGRVCVRYYKRADGTVLTQDCPVGWKLIKRRVSQMATAVCSLVFGIVGGLGMNAVFSQKDSKGSLTSFLQPTPEKLMGAIAVTPRNTPKSTPKPTPKPTPKEEPLMGDVTMGKIAAPQQTPKNH